MVHNLQERCQRNIASTKTQSCKQCYVRTDNIIKFHKKQLFQSRVVPYTDLQNERQMKETISKKQSYSTSQEISCLVWNLNIHYRVYKSLPVDSALTHLNSAHILTHYYFHIRYLSMSRSNQLDSHFQMFKLKLSDLSHTCYIV